MPTEKNASGSVIKRAVGLVVAFNQALYRSPILNEGACHIASFAVGGLGGAGAVASVAGLTTLFLAPERMDVATMTSSILGTSVFLGVFNPLIRRSAPSYRLSSAIAGGLTAVAAIVFAMKPDLPQWSHAEAAAPTAISASTARP